ncbi:hypothetical protein PPERSA_12233 [Pseudocohnilembus persalinus]|uniref:Uncharacterized protein n=1 Tax=Pseudocohnilembus persalinus TaxID=266149 RepID=A0A0V0R4S4_PSEPJ|nr:hypothetical protein PPERSA_12233 [Pseudocohnilembus persalinus]|eukprot:KRX09490.1 hypothetical protein PPERSA_12233 [Pseudocohnilembus persalinus]
MEKNQPQKKKLANQQYKSVQEKIFRISKSGQQLNDLDNENENENEQQKLQRRQTAQIDQYYNIYDLTQIDDKFDSELSQGKQGTSYIQSPAASVQRQQLYIKKRKYYWNSIKKNMGWLRK